MCMYTNAQTHMHAHNISIIIYLNVYLIDLNDTCTHTYMMHTCIHIHIQTYISVNKYSNII